MELSIMQSIRELKGSRWTGKAELWLDPFGNDAAHSDCTITVGEGAVSYTWSHDGDEHEGSLALRDGGADFTDTFHSPQPMSCATIDGAAGLVAVAGTYSAGEGPDWGWRITVSSRPTGELVLQMTNITPWGEYGRAMRMTCSRDP